MNDRGGRIGVAGGVRQGSELDVRTKKPRTLFAPSADV